MGYADDRDDDLIPLEIADVFRWLEDEGHLARPARKTRIKATSPSVQTGPQLPNDPSSQTHCSVCGLLHFISMPAKAEAGETAVKAEGDGQQQVQSSPPDICPLTFLHPTGFPLLDATQFLHNGRPERMPYNLTPFLLNQPEPAQDKLATYRSRDFVEAVDPHLTMSIRKIVASIHDQPVDDTLFHNQSSRDSVYDELAPFALLGSILKPLVARLVQGALEIAERDRIFLLGTGRVPPSSGPRLLTPSHVMRGLRRESGRDALFLAFSRLALPVDYGRLPTTPPEGTPHNNIKTEVV